MRILQFGRFNFRQIKGGVQYFADRIAYHLSLGDKYPIYIDEIVSGEGSKTQVRQENKWRQISVGQYANVSSVPLSPGVFWWAWKLLCKNSYDIVHLNFPDPLGMLAMFFVPKRFKIVVTWHTDIIRQKTLLKFYQPLLKIFMKRVDAIIVATPLHLPSCPQLAELKMDHKISVVPFGVEPSDWVLNDQVKAKAFEFRKSIDPSKMVIFAFGRHVYYKGFEYLVEAMKSLPNCFLILGGSGPLTENLKKQVRDLGLEDRIRFVGRIDEKDLAAYYYAADVFCLPSVDRTEAFGYVQVEAMMCGLPVVSTWLDNGVNYVSLDRETGLTVPIRDSRALAQALDQLRLDESLRKSLALKAYQRSHELFSAEKTAEGVYRVFREVAGTR